MAGTDLTQNPKIAYPQPMKELWQIQYSRFFNFPRITTRCHNLHPLSKRCVKNDPHGRWVSSSSSSMAALHLTYDQTARGFVLVVLFQGKVYEEHYISKLIFSWPQVTCMDECPVRGSRVVFASYRDSSGQVQKFAMRFSSSSDSQTFMNSLKEGLKDTRNVGPTSYSFVSEMAPPFINVPGKTAYDRSAEELSNLYPVGNCEPAVQPELNHEIMKHMCRKEPFLVHGSEASCASLPTSFTALMLDNHNKDEEPPKAPGTFHDNTQGFSASSSFHDMLTKLEMVIYELGGDLSL